MKNTSQKPSDGTIAPVDKISHAPTLWLLFGAGGMLSALLGVGLLLWTGFALPFGLGPFEQWQDYPQAIHLVRNPMITLILFALIALFSWHAAHRLYKCLHDFGFHPSPLTRCCTYGVAAVFCLIALCAIIRLY